MLTLEKHHPSVIILCRKSVLICTAVFQRSKKGTRLAGFGYVKIFLQHRIRKHIAINITILNYVLVFIVPFLKYLMLKN